MLKSLNRDCFRYVLCLAKMDCKYTWCFPWWDIENLAKLLMKVYIKLLIHVSLSVRRWLLFRGDFSFSPQNHCVQLTSSGTYITFRWLPWRQCRAKPVLNGLLQGPAGDWQYPHGQYPYFSHHAVSASSERLEMSSISLNTLKIKHNTTIIPSQMHILNCFF